LLDAIVKDFIVNEIISMYLNEEVY
jgi:hypothetical protein